MTDADNHKAPTDRDLVLTRLIDAPREKLFRAWTDPEMLKQWFAPQPFTTPVAELDVRPGGARRLKHHQYALRRSEADGCRVNQ